MPTVTHFVAGMGTFGTLRGVSTVLRKHNPAIKIIGIEPVLGQRVDGLRNMNEPSPPSIFDMSFIDEKLNIMRADAMAMAREVAKTNGLLVGVSSGASIWGAREIAKKLDKGIIVIISPDRGEKYLSTDLFE